MKQHGTRSNARGLADRNKLPPAQGIANADVTLWLAISTAVESLSWEEVVLNEVYPERNARKGMIARNTRLILAADLIGQLTMSPDDLLAKCQQLAQARNCRLFRGRDGSIAFELRQPKSKLA
jgi:hypothetical protein